MLVFFITESVLKEYGVSDIRAWFIERFGEGASAEQVYHALKAERHRGWIVRLLALDSDLTRELLALGVSPNMEAPPGWKPLYYTRSPERGEVAEALIAGGADVDVFAACGLGRECQLQEILGREPAQVAARDVYGDTPLHWAVTDKQEACIMLLLQEGADVNAISPTPHATPLHYAVYLAHEEGYEGIVKLLLAAGAALGIQDCTGLSVLDFAALESNITIMEILIASGADVNLSNRHGETPLHIAAGAGLVDALKLLIESGADLNARSLYGKTPLGEALDPLWRLPDLREKYGDAPLDDQLDMEDLPAYWRATICKRSEKKSLEAAELLREHGAIE